MLQGWVIVVTSFAYLGLLFAIAYYADQRADSGRLVIASPYIYSLSLAVYATAWTFYGSVGRAAVNAPAAKSASPGSVALLPAENPISASPAASMPDPYCPAPSMNVAVPNRSRTRMEPDSDA